MGPSQNNEIFRSVREIPEKYQSIFSGYPCFNRMQSAVFNDIFTSNSIVVTAPTGSGKTVLFELALVKLLMDSPNPQDVKAVYIAPVKALCSERYQDWYPKFSSLGISCVEVTGDSLDQTDLKGYQLILTTPEKWDSLTRRWRDNMSLVQRVQLIMIDEVHLLSDCKRGPVLETIVCRMKTVMKALKNESQIRFIAVSATIFNIEDLAQWLGTASEPAKFHRFGNETRPVELKRVVKGYPQAKGQSPFLFDIQLSYKLKPILVDYAEGKPVLIFCSTRRGVMQTCKVLVEQLHFNFSSEQTEVLSEVAENVSDAKLREYVRSGVGFHHAGLTLVDRTRIQDIFTASSLPVLVATTTLAMGVNLPAHLVIIKSTVQYESGRTREYPESYVLQMLGRAGRPQFDTSATAVIMTRFDMVNKYKNLLDCKEVLESGLHLHLAEHLNSEIVLHTITDLAVAMSWLESTFLYQRAHKNPQHYGLTSGSRSKIEKDLETMVLRELNALQRAELIELRDNGMDVSPTADGRLMSHYYINLNTFQLFKTVQPTASIKTLLQVLSQANELSEVQLRVTERRLLNELNVNKHSKTIRFPMSGKVKTREMKINCLAQTCLGCIPISDPALSLEVPRVIGLLERVAKCLTEYQSRRESYCALLSSIVVTKCLHAKLWENSPYVARQLDRIGPTLGAALVAHGKTSFDALLQSHPHELETILNRSAPMGHRIIEQVRQLPRYSLLVNVERSSVLNATARVQVGILNRIELSQGSTAGPRHAVSLLVGDTNNRMLHYRRVLDSSLCQEELNFSVSLPPPLPQKIIVHLISEQWVGLDVTRDVVINPMASALVTTNCFMPTMEPEVKKPAKKTPKVTQKVSLDYWKKVMGPPQTSAAVSPPSELTQSYTKTEPLMKNKSTLQNFVADWKKSEPSFKVGNKEKVCCFDIEPDWNDLLPDSSPEVDQQVTKESSILKTKIHDLPGNTHVLDSAEDDISYSPLNEVENEKINIAHNDFVVDSQESTFNLMESVATLPLKPDDSNQKNGFVEEPLTGEYSQNYFKNLQSDPVNEIPALDLNGGSIPLENIDGFQRETYFGLSQNIQDDSYVTPRKKGRWDCESMKEVRCEKNEKLTDLQCKTSSGPSQNFQSNSFLTQENWNQEPKEVGRRDSNVNFLPKIQPNSVLSKESSIAKKICWEQFSREQSNEKNENLTEQETGGKSDLGRWKVQVEEVGNLVGTLLSQTTYKKPAQFMGECAPMESLIRGQLPKLTDVTPKYNNSTMVSQPSKYKQFSLRHRQEVLDFKKTKPVAKSVSLHCGSPVLAVSNGDGLRNDRPTSATPASLKSYLATFLATKRD